MGTEVTELLLGGQSAPDKVRQIVNNQDDVPRKHVGFIYGAKREDDANELIKSVRPEYIVMIGLEEYGKTTFLGSFYHRLRSDGKIDSQLMIDSDTLSGFEHKVFLRAINKEGKSDVARTSSKDPFILSVDLQDEQSGVKRQIVISDRAGETYFQYLSDDSLVKNDKTLSRADKVILFVDSEKMIGNQYVAMMDDYRMLLTRLKNAKKFPPCAMLYVVFNKIDKIKKSKAVFEKRKAGMLDIFKILKDKADGVFEVDSKHLDDNDTDIWKLQQMLVNPS